MTGRDQSAGGEGAGGGGWGIHPRRPLSGPRLLEGRLWFGLVQCTGRALPWIWGMFRDRVTYTAIIGASVIYLLNITVSGTGEGGLTLLAF